MQSAQSQYSYFENLEKTIKWGLAIYLTVLLAGIIIDAAGLKTLADELGSPPRMVVTAAALCAVAYGLFYGISEIHWLGELHIRLDRNLFGFLKKSNESIFAELLAALDPDERDSAVNIETEEKGALAKSIFSRLANDDRLFSELLESGIFRFWIWYWIMIYGTLIFTILTALSFAIAVLGREDFTRPIFAVNWILALLHIAACLFLGKYLLHMTRKTVGGIVSAHRNEIAAMLRANIRTFQTTL